MAGGHKKECEPLKAEKEAAEAAATAELARLALGRMADGRPRLAAAVGAAQHARAEEAGALLPKAVVWVEAITIGDRLEAASKLGSWTRPPRAARAGPKNRKKVAAALNATIVASILHRGHHGGSCVTTALCELAEDFRVARRRSPRGGSSLQDVGLRAGPPALAGWPAAGRRPRRRGWRS